MIEVNLLPGPKKRKARAGIALPDFSSLAAKVKDPLLVGAVGSWVLAGGIIAALYSMESRKIAALEEELSQVERSERQFRALIAQKQREEQLRDSLRAELEAIRAIDSDRYNWPHILDEVSKALPDYTWLERLSVLAPAPGGDTLAASEIRFEIEGRTADMAGYTRFLRQLNASPWLTGIVPGATRAVVEEDRAVFAFNVIAAFRRADSAFIRTVPVIESLVR
jgi:Tfp pilus assembly protein PilN